MAIYNYNKLNIEVNILQSEIVSAVGPVNHITHDSDGNLDIDMVNTLTSAEETTLNNTVTNHDPSLSIAKSDKILAIDNKTQTLISAGFSYGGQIFSLSEKAQINWIGLKQSSDAGLITFPYDVTTKDDVIYSIADSTALTDFYTQGLGTVSYHLTSGRNLKDSVKAATTVAEVDAIIDNR